MQTSKTEKLYTLIQLLRPLVKHLTRAVEIELAGTGLSVGQRAVLEWIAIHQTRTAPQLAAHLDVKRQSIQPVLDDMVVHGWIQRLANPNHKRSWRYGLTPEGQRRIHQVRAVEDANLDAMGDDFHLRDIDAAIRVLETLTDKFSQFPQTKQKP